MVSKEICFWCREPTGVEHECHEHECHEHECHEHECHEHELPPKLITSYEVCDKCEALIGNDTQIVEVDIKPTTPGQPEIQPGLYPTMRWWIVPYTQAVSFFGREAMKLNPSVIMMVGCAKILGLEDDKGRKRLH